MTKARSASSGAGVRDLLIAASLGTATGFRTFTALALASRRLSRRRPGRLAGMLARGNTVDPVRHGLSSVTAGRVLPALAIGELIADKLPGIPARIEAGPLVGRAFVGAVLGWSAGRGRLGRAAAAAIGAAAAVAGAKAGYHARRRLTERHHVPDSAIAVIEDAITVTVASAAVSRMR